MVLPWFSVIVAGPSMLPTIAPGEWLLVRRGARVVPGAVVVVHRPGRLVVKRAVALTAAGWWIEGDNAAVSDDSRSFGAVPEVDVVGVVRWRYRPLAAAGRVR